MNIKRELYMKQIRPFIGNELIKVLTGIRRCGKSVMLELIKDELAESGVSPEQFVSINFEQMKNARLCTAEALYEELQLYISKADGKLYMFFDEIQEVKNWERCINSLRIDCDCDIYITGSNAKLLSGELATYLAGRYVEFVIYPFSFSEFIEAEKQNNSYVSVQESFKHYKETGGMPSLINLPNNEDACIQYLKDIYNSVMLKDIVKRNNIRDVDLLERVITFVLSNIGHTFSASSLTKYLKSESRKVSNDTILNYIKNCTNAFLFYKISREDLIGKKILTVNEKYYVVDHALRDAVYGQSDRDIDQILENMVCLELLRRGYAVTVGLNKTKEIDFVAVKKNKKIYVQVSYILATPETVSREFGAYDGIPDNFPKYVVSMDEFDMSRNGIKHMNIRDFLLADEY